MGCKAAVLVVLVILYGLASAGYTDCGSENGSIVAIVVSNCSPNAKRCILRRNTNATMTITFTSTKISQNLKADVHGVILGVPVPFDLPNADGCKDSGVSCPVQPSTQYKYFTRLPIQPSYPRVTVDIRWELQDDDGKDIICAIIPAKIQ